MRCLLCLSVLYMSMLAGVLRGLGGRRLRLRIGVSAHCVNIRGHGRQCDIV